MLEGVVRGSGSGGRRVPGRGGKALHFRLGSLCSSQPWQIR
ncbi:unnamed protein product [Chondrus crispus]|uniref:Uncharacterized protein n=1 Tax=Chondrus crispus TaxID=2769 RepID=R7QTE6_CHOCR|nr:unnamed protein product [Chondrus crispus]CDF40640.1 unnamed protein product [Chondrus crispus]|eukprot:XP_005710934.1 unnamed protein product [Chondrus crispus]